MKFWFLLAALLPIIACIFAVLQPGAVSSDSEKNQKKIGVSASNGHLDQTKDSTSFQLEEKLQNQMIEKARERAARTLKSTEETVERMAAITAKLNNHEYFSGAAKGMIQKNRPKYQEMLSGWQVNERDSSLIYEALYDLEYQFFKGSIKMNLEPSNQSNDRLKNRETMKQNQDADEMVAESKLLPILGPERTQQILQLRNRLTKESIDEVKRKSERKLND